MPFQQPADLDEREWIVRGSRNCAVESPWRLEEHDFWRLNVPSLEEGIVGMNERTEHRQTTAKEAWVIAKLKWFLAWRLDLKTGEQLNVQMNISDIAAWCIKHLEARRQGGGAQN